MERFARVEDFEQTKIEGTLRQRRLEGNVEREMSGLGRRSFVGNANEAGGGQGLYIMALQDETY
jgi:hypothetical protein